MDAHFLQYNRKQNTLFLTHRVKNWMILYSTFSNFYILILGRILIHFTQQHLFIKQLFLEFITTRSFIKDSTFVMLNFNYKTLRLANKFS